MYISSRWMIQGLLSKVRLIQVYWSVHRDYILLKIQSFIYIKDNKLLNIDFGEEIIRDIKFIENHDSIIYLYGSFIKIDFCNTGNDHGDIKGRHIAAGEYGNGDYNTYLIITGDSNIEIIMENKNNSEFYRNTINLAELLHESIDPVTLKGVGFKDNSFVFLYRKNNEYLVKTGKVFFTKFYPDNYSETIRYEYDDIQINNYKIRASHVVHVVSQSINMRQLS